MKRYFLILLLFSFKCHAIMCGAPKYVEKIPSGSTIFIGKFQSIVQSKIEYEDAEVIAGNGDDYYAVVIALFENVKVIDGPQKDVLYVKFIANGGINNWYPMPPDIKGAYYLFSFNSDSTDGSLEKPFLVGPCDMYKRI